MQKRPIDLQSLRPTVGQFAALVGKTGRWIAELRAKGIMPADGATLAEFVQAWAAYTASGARRSGKGD